MMNRATRAAVGTLIIAAALQHGECLRVSGARSPTRARCGVPSRLLRMAADANDAQFNEELPPSLLADAWTKQDIVKDLVDRLKGCSIVIVGHRRAAQSSGALALARRLKDKRYRYLDLYDIVTQCAGGKSPAEVKEAEGEEGLRALETAILSEAKAWPRCVLFAANAGSTPANWAHMQQAIVVCIEAKPGPKSDDLWVEQADVTVQVSAEVRARHASTPARTGSEGPQKRARPALRPPR